jgi:hypothetical protein
VRKSDAGEFPFVVLGADLHSQLVDVLLMGAGSAWAQARLEGSTTWRMRGGLGT